MTWFSMLLCIFTLVELLVIKASFLENLKLKLIIFSVSGLPKPAVIKQSRYVAGGYTFYKSAGLNKNDILYITLPLYHANGIIIGMGSGLINGITIVLRKK